MLGNEICDGFLDISNNSRDESRVVWTLDSKGKSLVAAAVEILSTSKSILRIEGESPLPAYHDLLEHQAVFAEHTVAPSAGTHSCPYFAYFQPLQPSSSNSSESVSYGDISTSHTFTAVDLHYHSWDHHSAPFSSGNDQSAVPSATIRSRGDSDRSFAPPFLLGHG
ncbi:hypothetical protein GIB67_039409 [Kingdonia uniflora]|uniref:Uncharacterized protein n=1 Tax=Kingdonia uniflora TaxID=39325 RepID=A0A7J7LIG9_9MAGN|nr:hypothetical protein GIB67_039409 [Kingdonia uniflora]